MAIYIPSTYGQIQSDTFNYVKNQVKQQTICDKKIVLSYINTQNDFDILAKTLDSSFYNLPFSIYTIQYGDRIDNISYNFFGDTDFWWLILMFNNLVDPFTMDNVTSINIPKQDPLRMYLSQKKFISSTI